MGAFFLGHFGGRRQAGDRVFPVANTRHEPTEPTEPEAETDSRRRARGKIPWKAQMMAWGYYSWSPVSLFFSINFGFFFWTLYFPTVLKISAFRLFSFIIIPLFIDFILF